jgi:hypothetical protein
LVNTLLKIALKSTFLPILNYQTSWMDLGVTNIGHGPPSSPKKKKEKLGKK